MEAKGQGVGVHVGSVSVGDGVSDPVYEEPAVTGALADGVPESKSDPRCGRDAVDQGL